MWIHSETRMWHDSNIQLETLFRTQIENKKKELEKNKVDVYSLRENHKEFKKAKH